MNSSLRDAHDPCERTDQPRASPDWRELRLPARGQGAPRVKVRCYPGPPANGVLVWAHGGSWIAGSVEAWHLPVAALARATGRTVLSVDYRLAPRWPYPAPLEDLMTVLDWVAEQLGASEQLAAAGGVRPPLLVGGDSAGATLAAAAALRCRDQGIPLDGQVLAYPPLDPSCSQPSYRRDPNSFPTRNAMLDAWQAYRGNDGDDGASYLTPWAAADLSCLAPTLIVVGELDPVVDDCRHFAGRLREHGSPASVQVFPGAGHGLFLLHRPDGSFPLQEWLGRSLAAGSQPSPAIVPPPEQPLSGKEIPCIAPN